MMKDCENCAPCGILRCIKEEQESFCVHVLFTYVTQEYHVLVCMHINTDNVYILPSYDIRKTQFFLDTFISVGVLLLLCSKYWKDSFKMRQK